MARLNFSSSVGSGAFTTLGLARTVDAESEARASSMRSCRRWSASAWITGGFASESLLALVTLTAWIAGGGVTARGSSGTVRGMVSSSSFMKGRLVFGFFHSNFGRTPGEGNGRVSSSSSAAGCGWGLGVSALIMIGSGWVVWRADVRRCGLEGGGSFSSKWDLLGDLPGLLPTEPRTVEASKLTAGDLADAKAAPLLVYMTL
mmetsp:Transcript_18683/g.38200  ORF Transcript_18683/g.38200 Transcript_18683/m.38200 type:complete len:203 (+) Transcript_18683:1260-1868(+)